MMKLLKFTLCLLALTLILQFNTSEANMQEKEVYFTYRKGDAVKHIQVGSSLIARLEADGWKADVHDQPPAPKRGRKKKQEILDEGDGLPEVIESEE